MKNTLDKERVSTNTKLLQDFIEVCQQVFCNWLKLIGSVNRSAINLFDTEERCKCVNKHNVKIAWVINK